MRASDSRLAKLAMNSCMLARSDDPAEATLQPAAERHEWGEDGEVERATHNEGRGVRRQGHGALRLVQDFWNRDHGGERRTLGNGDRPVRQERDGDADGLRHHYA